MEFRVLGPVEVRDGDHELPLGGQLQRALLALLLTRANEVVPTDRLIDVLWSGSPPRAARNVIQGHVSDLRKLLGRDVIVTHRSGYAIVVEPERLDLHRFERLLEEGSGALADGRPVEAAEKLREGLALWRGQALADVADEPELRLEVGRLEELRLVALERRVEADLALGRNVETVGELEAMVAQHPHRERPLEQLMLALYRSGRHADALEAYRSERLALTNELGLEPTRGLKELERAILRQDPELDLAPASASDPAILVVSLAAAGLDALLPIVEPLAARTKQEVIVAEIVSAADELGPATNRVHDCRGKLTERGVAARAAAFRSSAPGHDAVRLAVDQDVVLMVVDGGPGYLEDESCQTMLLEAPCDVGVLVGRRESLAAGPVLVPFVGADHDWAAVELAAWAATAMGTRLLLAGPGGGEHDASRLLADASLAVQRVVGVAAEPMLVGPGAETLIQAAAGVALVVVGLPDGWRRSGLGPVRRELAARAESPVLVVRRGLRPGGLAPKAAATRFTWSLSPA